MPKRRVPSTDSYGTPVCIGEGVVKWESMEIVSARPVRYEVSKAVHGLLKRKKR